MELSGKVAIVYGAGPMGAAVARAFGADGATVVLAGRTLARVRGVADEIEAAGGSADAHQLDVDDRAAVDAHAEDVAATFGHLDVSFNAVATDALQGVALVDLALDDFLAPLVASASHHFTTMTAAARIMARQGHGAIVTLTSSAAREWRHQMGGFSLACGVVETMTRTMAGELKGSGVRVAGIRANFTPETSPSMPPPVPGEGLLADTLLPHLPRLSDIAAAAVFLASDRAGATTGTMLDLTCGAIVT